LQVELGWGNGKIDDVFFVAGYGLEGSVVSQVCLLSIIASFHLQYRIEMQCDEDIGTEWPSEQFEKLNLNLLLCTFEILRPLETYLLVIKVLGRNEYALEECVLSHIDGWKHTSMAQLRSCLVNGFKCCI
jgi:hypothetical protein